MLLTMLSGTRNTQVVQHSTAKLRPLSNAHIVINIFVQQISTPSPTNMLNKRYVQLNEIE